MKRLSSRFLRPEDVKLIKKVSARLREAGLTPVTDPALIARVQKVRNSVASIREADEMMKDSKKI